MTTSRPRHRVHPCKLSLSTVFIDNTTRLAWKIPAMSSGASKNRAKVVKVVTSTTPRPRRRAVRIRDALITCAARTALRVAIPNQRRQRVTTTKAMRRMATPTTKTPPTRRPPFARNPPLESRRRSTSKTKTACPTSKMPSEGYFNIPSVTAAHSATSTWTTPGASPSGNRRVACAPREACAARPPFSRFVREACARTTICCSNSARRMIRGPPGRP